MSQAAAALKQKRKNANKTKVPFTVPDLSKVIYLVKKILTTIQKMDAKHIFKTVIEISLIV